MISTKKLLVSYKNDYYSVRNNGTVLRHTRSGKRPRKFDNEWTFGKPNDYGYMLIGSEVVHRIVAHAFLGDSPTAQHVVDHLDTNRQNNRPENLRWLTKLENIVNNPITVKRIIFRCGSIEAFLENPSILKDYIKEDPKFDWMRTVTPEEAKITWERLNKWAKKGDSNLPENGSLGEWIYKDNYNYASIEPSFDFTLSESPIAAQRDWKTPFEFPSCPKNITEEPIRSYAGNLKNGEVFSRNKYSYSIITDFALSEDGNSLWVLCKAAQEHAIKPWLLAQITFEKNLFVHTNLGSFFGRKGAEKVLTRAQGGTWDKGDTIDDFT